MSYYPVLKYIHVATACTTVILFTLRLGLDVAGRPGWRETPLRWLPHLNDTVLLSAAIALLFVTGWTPFVHHWLTAKIILLGGYIVAGRYAIKPEYGCSTRVVAAAFAFVQIALIFWLALNKPLF